MKKYFIDAAGPTPNGKLHLGHMAGPYLTADIFNRTQLLNGNHTFFACGLDKNQSYVRLAAIRNNTTREELLAKNAEYINDTFASYDIGCNSLSDTDEEGKVKFITTFISPLLRSEHVVMKNVEFYFDESSNKFLVEAFISGTCPKCAHNVKGGVCEKCSYYNFSTDLISPLSTINPDAKLIKKACTIYVLDISPLHEQLIDLLNMSSIEDSIKKSVISILRDVKEFPVTLPVEDGIVFENNTETKLNPWIDGFSSIYYLKNIAKESLNCKKFEDLSHVCFIGIDNTFYFTLIFNAIRICLGLKDFPETYCINKYYLLNNDKFSTSRNNAVWADDMVEQYDINLLRIFLALSYPDEDNYNFTPQQLDDFQQNLKSNNWINKLYSLMSQADLDNIKPLDSTSPKSTAQLLLNILNDNNADKSQVSTLMQVLCPSLSKKILRKTKKMPQIVKKMFNPFKKELGVKANRLIYLDENKFSSSIVVVENGKQVPPHKHDAINELFYILEGDGLLEISNQQSNVGEGDYVFIPAGQLHTIKNVNCSKLKFITIAWQIA
jgi:methionyl-tRNA synthetase